MAAAAAASRRRPVSTTAAASAVPQPATASVTPGAPTSAAYGVNVESAWAYASRPQEKPPSGNRPRTHSASTQASATHSGHQRNRSSSVIAAPRPAWYSARKADSPSHASTPMTSIQVSSSTKNASPWT